jgi:glycosyltransferase involved in cell wall biosynthesis
MRTDITAARPDPAVDVTIIMPCLNESRSLAGCIANAHAALSVLRERLDLSGEILVADNGSTDGSREIASACGARVIRVQRMGYGAALSGGAEAARGRYLVMGDADGSYDFREAAAMVQELVQGADLCLGSRFQGEIKPGAMPWKNRYIGNPVLTGILNLLFRAGVSDAHCGLRALTRSAFQRLGMASAGMEFASEMVIKAALTGCRISEVPATLSPDTRGRPPHLRPWRDGWRHLRYLLMLSPTWVFALPALLLALLSLAILGGSAVVMAGARQPVIFGNYWVVLAGAMLGISHIAGLLAAATHLYGVREGYRRPSAWTMRLAQKVSLETMLIAGVLSAAAGFAILTAVAAYWSVLRFNPIANVLPAVIGTSLIVIGGQNALGGFLLAILNGNEAEFLRHLAQRGQRSENLGLEVPHGAPR